MCLRDQRKRYPRVEALKGISLSLPAGEIWGLLGPNGNGKCTFLKCIAGLRRPDVRELEILGMPPSRRTKEQLAYVPEEENL